MRCYCCDANLSDYESTLKSATTGQYLDMCRKCLKDSDIPVMKNNHNPDVTVTNDFEVTEQDWVEFMEEHDDD